MQGGEMVADKKTADMLSRVRSAKHIRSKSEKETLMKRIRKICSANDTTRQYQLRIDSQRL